MPFDLVLVRHGESEGNREKKQFEAGNPESYADNFFLKHDSQYLLTTLGENQAKKTGNWLIKNKLSEFDRAYVSNIVRAQQTAGYLDLDIDWFEHYDLRERDGGLFYTFHPDHRDQHYQEEQKHWNTQPFLFRPPQGESMADVTTRIKGVLDTIARECSGKKVIIVCHGHVIRAFRIAIERMPIEKANNLLIGDQDWAQVPNCSIFHYSRIDPNNGKPEKYLNWLRIISPSQDLDGEWNKIIRPRFSNEELLKRALNNSIVPD